MVLLRPDFLRGISLRCWKNSISVRHLDHPKHLRAAAESSEDFRASGRARSPGETADQERGDQWLGTRNPGLASFPNVHAKLSGLEVTEAGWEAWTPEDIWPYLDVGLRMPRSGPIDDRVGLAGVPLRGVLQAGDERR